MPTTVMNKLMGLHYLIKSNFKRLIFVDDENYQKNFATLHMSAKILICCSQV